jgi:hypothetical protein
MAKVAAFHSKNQTDVYHNNDKCGAGAEIPHYDRVPGKSDKRLCKNCKKLP